MHHDTILRAWCCLDLGQMPRKNIQMPRKNIRSGHVREGKYRTRGGLIRETAYLYADEEQALEDRAQRERCSKSEIIRRALRVYLRIAD